MSRSIRAWVVAAGLGSALAPVTLAPVTLAPVTLTLAALGLVVLAGAAVPAGAVQAPCLAAAGLRGFAQDLPNARAAIADGKALVIVALGSSSTLGTGASSEEHSYPAVLQAELSRLLGGHDIRVVNAGVGSNSAHQMLLRLDHDVIDEEPKLVIWQTGMFDAVHDIGIDTFKRILRKGIARLREHGIDVVLMDQQPLPDGQRYTFYADYLAALREVAAETGTPVFRRFDVMADLLRSGLIGPDDMFTTGASHAVDRGYYCTAVNLAHTLAEKLSPRAAGAHR